LCYCCVGKGRRRLLLQIFPHCCKQGGIVETSGLQRDFHNVFVIHGLVKPHSQGNNLKRILQTDGRQWRLAASIIGIARGDGNKLTLVSTPLSTSCFVLVRWRCDLHGKWCWLCCACVCVLCDD
jgi:hypothetical protein